MAHIRPKYCIFSPHYFSIYTELTRMPFAEVTFMLMYMHVGERPSPSDYRNTFFANISVVFDRINSIALIGDHNFENP